MRKLSVSVVFVALMIVSVTLGARQWPVSGIFPDPPYCPTCFVASYVDAPTAGSTIAGNEVFWAWAGQCHNGASLTAVDATAVVSGQPVSVQMDYVMGGQRPDVAAHLQASGCHGGHNVIAAWFPSGLPHGTERISMRLRYFDTFAWYTFEVQGLGASSSLQDAALKPTP